MADVVLNHKAAADGLEKNSRSLRVDRWIETRSLPNLSPFKDGPNSPLMAEMAPIMTSTGVVPFHRYGLRCFT